MHIPELNTERGDQHGKEDDSASATSSSSEAVELGSEKQYSLVIKTETEIVAESLRSDARSSHNKNYAFIADLTSLHKIIEVHAESRLLEEASREYQYAVFAATSGRYKQGFSSLRSYFELTLAMIFFSSNKYRYRLWLRGEADINWSEITENENGILSKSFVRAFCEELCENADTFRNLSRSVYRECSEYLHSNPTVQPQIPSVQKFDLALFEKWQDLADSAHLCVLFIIVYRYHHTLNPAQINLIRPIIEDRLLHIKEVRSLFGLVE